jgi:hypothetical protein
LLAVAADIPPVRITKTDLAYSADARTGRATATFLPADVDTTFVQVIITYADGVTDQLGVQNMVEMGGPYVWRMAIGADVDHNQGPPRTIPRQHRGTTNGNRLRFLPFSRQCLPDPGKARRILREYPKPGPAVLPKQGPRAAVSGAFAEHRRRISQPQIGGPYPHAAHP